MKATLIFDLTNVLLPLEVEVIRRVIDLNTLIQTGYTVNHLKCAWLEDRLEEMKWTHFIIDPHRVDHATLYKVKSLSRDLDTPLYRSIHIPDQFRCMSASLEIRSNDLFLYIR